MSGTKIGWLGCALLLVLSACGRIGVHLIPAGGSGRDASASSDAGPGATDGGMTDGGLPDGGGMGGGFPDGGGMGGGSDAMVASCSASCQNDHGAADCTSGSCTLSCSIGYKDCDDDTANGCEMSTLDSVASCGVCGHS